MTKWEALSETFLRRAEYRSAHARAKQTAVLTQIFLVNPPSIDAPHPLMATRLASASKYIETFPPIVNAVAVGDSLLDIPRNSFSCLPSKQNFSISGSWANHMEQMIRGVHQAGLSTRRVKNIVIGSLGGNPLLVNQSLQFVIGMALSALNTTRILFPESRIIVYGLPPVYSIHAATNSFAFESVLWDWVQKDHNAVFIPFLSFGRGFLKLLPRETLSNDGVHFTPWGVYLFDRMLLKALTAPITPLLITD